MLHVDEIPEVMIEVDAAFEEDGLCLGATQYDAITAILKEWCTR